MFVTVTLVLCFIDISTCLPSSSSRDCPPMCTCGLRPVNNLFEDCDNCDVDENNDNNNNADDPCHNCDRTTHSCVGCDHVINYVTITSVTCRNIALVEVPLLFPTMMSLLDLSDNKLTRLHAGIFGHLSHVVTLRLSRNLIRDIGRDTFRSLGFIQRLDIDINNLTRLDVSMFSGAESLENLNLSHNQLQTIDSAFTRLTNLTRLDLRHNRLIELTRNTFKGLINLRYLILTDNKLAHIDVRAFRHLEKLVYLVLKGNEQLGVMKSDRFYFHSASLLNYL